MISGIEEDVILLLNVAVENVVGTADQLEKIEDDVRALGASGCHSGGGGTQSPIFDGAEIGRAHV